MAEDPPAYDAAVAEEVPPPESSDDAATPEDGGTPRAAPGMFKEKKVAEFLVKQTGQVAQAIFLPEGSRMNTQQLQGLFLNQWKMEMPSALIASDAGTVHPKLFANHKLVNLTSFETYWADAKKHAVEQAHLSAGPEVDTFALTVINDVIFLKMTSIFSNVLDAAELADMWLIIDRVNAKSPAAELLIEAALSRTTARPKIIVIDAYSRLLNFTGENGNGELSVITQQSIESLEFIAAGGVLVGTDAAPDRRAIGQFYSADEYMMPEKYYDMALPRPAEKAHVLPDGSLPARVKWQYHYLQTFFGMGTHYIVLETPNDAPNLGCFGQFSYIAANGQGMMFDRLKTCIRSGQNLVMLHNTGGVTQAFAALRQGMLSGVPPPDSTELLNIVSQPSAERILPCEPRFRRHS